MMRVLPSKALLAFVLTLSGLTAAHAGVNPRNGNFFISYEVSGSASPTITYNSKAQDRGWYGYGWGSLFETRLLVLGDGSAVVLEYGTGRQTVYGRKGGASPNEQLIQTILDDVTAVDKLDPGEVAALRRTLADRDARIGKVKAYGLSRSMPAGAQLAGEGCEQARLTKADKAYERIDCDGNLDRFNEQGWLLSRRDAQGRIQQAVYENSPFPVAWIEADGTRVSLRWNERGQIIGQSRTGKDGKATAATLRYDAKGNLDGLSNTDGWIYRFVYDERHNMTEIVYEDHSKWQMTYDAQDAVTSVLTRSGDHTRYEYATDPATGIDSTVILSKDRNGVEQRRTLRYAHDGLPVRTEDQPGRWIEYSYHPVLRKVVHMRSADTERRFEYDERGQVIFAQDVGTQRTARFTYDGKGRVTRLLSREGSEEARDLSFRYNEQGKPIEIRLQGIGHIEVRYRPDGEIEAVNSPQGAKVALAVTQAFQSMLSIVKMSGASLGY